MLIITEDAYDALFKALTDNLHKKSGYVPPPILNWYMRVIKETRNIEDYTYLRNWKVYQYNLGHSLGVAKVRCFPYNKMKIFVITSYQLNGDALFTWKFNDDKGYIIKPPKPPKPKKSYRRIRKTPLFGYTFVMNDKKQYNLIDKDGNLVAKRWFKAIKPITDSKPYGRYQIIAYVNVDGMYCALGYDGEIYELNRSWYQAFAENRIHRYIRSFLNEMIESKYDNISSSTPKKSIYLTESELRTIVNQVVEQIKIGINREIV
jgi:hypothetical protein